MMPIPLLASDDPGWCAERTLRGISAFESCSLLLPDPPAGARVDDAGERRRVAQGDCFFAWVREHREQMLAVAVEQGRPRVGVVVRPCAFAPPTFDSPARVVDELRLRS